MAGITAYSLSYIMDKTEIMGSVAVSAIHWIAGNAGINYRFYFSSPCWVSVGMAIKAVIKVGDFNYLGIGAGVTGLAVWYIVYSGVGL
jgi:hypothetical protein